MRRGAPSYREAGPLQKLFAFVVGTILLVLGLMFSAVVLVALVAVGLAVWAYLWWKTRELRRAMREATVDRRPGGDIIEGEAIVVEETRASVEHNPPADSNDKR
jgi:hypothetical protein